MSISHSADIDGQLILLFDRCAYCLPFEIPTIMRKIWPQKSVRSSQKRVRLTAKLRWQFGFMIVSWNCLQKKHTHQAIVLVNWEIDRESPRATYRLLIGTIPTGILSNSSVSVPRKGSTKEPHSPIQNSARREEEW